MIEGLKTKLIENKKATDSGIKIKGETDFDTDIYNEGFELIMFGNCSP